MVDWNNRIVHEVAALAAAGERHIHLNLLDG
jgi:hypothetical protein